MRTIDCWDGTAWIADASPVTVLTTVVANTPIFRYFDFTGTRVPLGGGTLDADSRDVLSVSITFDLEDTTDEQFIGDEHPALRLDAQVRLHNLERPVTEEQ